MRPQLSLVGGILRLHVHDKKRSSRVLDRTPFHILKGWTCLQSFLALFTPPEPHTYLDHPTNPREFFINDQAGVAHLKAT